MRIKREIIEIEYEKTKEFFEHRAEKYTDQYPYVTTMYQDSNPQLTELRNQNEIRKVIPRLQLETSSNVLDMGCGVGRWATALQENIQSYMGIDFSAKLIEIARQRNNRDNFFFECMSVCDFFSYYKQNNLHPFDRLIISGVLMYLNDLDVQNIFHSLSDILAPGAIVYLREPVGIEERLTLKDFYSQELAHQYNTIYRSVNEYKLMLAEYATTLSISEEGFLFDQQAFNNRKETCQYFFILKKENIS